MAVVETMQYTAWADLFNAADFNALASNGFIRSTATAVDNSTGYLWMDVSFIMATSTVSPTLNAGLDLMILPQLHDGSTYVSGDDGTTEANFPGAGNLAGRISFWQKSSSQVNGYLRKIDVPYGSFKVGVINRMNVAMPSSSTNMTCKYRLGRPVFT